MGKKMRASFKFMDDSLSLKVLTNHAFMGTHGEQSYKILCVVKDIIPES